jgi:hypothetical protein
MKLTILLFTLLGISLSTNAQTRFKVAEKFYSGLPDTLTNQIISSLDKLLISIDEEKLDTTLIDEDNFDFNRNFFTYLKGIEDKDTMSYYFQGRLINLYPIENKCYSITIAYVCNGDIGRIFTFIVKKSNGKFVFASPIKYNTKHWKTITIGTITLCYPDTINTIRAGVFNHKNIVMASKLKLPVRNWDLYMCRNYQEALQLQGCSYEFKRNGIVNLGDITGHKTLFSIMNNEDFSHDVFHNYAANIRGKISRNFTAEEGIAYTWGNAYYADSKGEIPEQQELISALRKYIKAHSEIKLLDLFDKNPYILVEYDFPKPISVKSTISGMICDEIERQKGVDGIIELLKCGRGDENFFKSIDELIGINRNNFEEKVYKLLFNDE